MGIERDIEILVYQLGKSIYKEVSPYVGPFIENVEKASKKAFDAAAYATIKGADLAKNQMEMYKRKRIAEKVVAKVQENSLQSYTIEEVAEMFLVDEIYVKYWIDTNNLKACNDGGGKYTISGSDIKNFIENYWLQ